MFCAGRVNPLRATEVHAAAPENAPASFTLSAEREVYLMRFGGQYLATMIGLATAVFGLIAALSWNTAITDLIKVFLPAGKGLVPEFVYAIVITITGIIVMVNLGKLAERTGEKSIL